MICPSVHIHGDSTHSHIREVDGKNVVIAYICFQCRKEWWASKEYRDRFGKPTDLYYDSETSSVKSDKESKP